MEIKISKSNQNKKQAFINTVENSLRAIYKVGKENEMSYEVEILKKARQNPDLWYRHLVVEK
jgi:hypothetical protein